MTMSDMSPSQLRDRIQQILAEPSSASPVTFHEIAKVYSSLIHELNGRLGICNRWLDLGLRTEAIHMATLEPDLLDSMGQLDLGDSLRDWTELCVANEADVPPRANWELASFVNSAWDREAELTTELRSFRLAMLTLCSVKTRLECLRKLLEVDPENIAWDTMIRQHERVRQQELRQELQEATDNNDLGAANALVAQIRDVNWLEPPPLDLLDGSVAARHRVKSHRVGKEYQKISNRLHDAMAAGDEPKAITLRARWRDIEKASKLEPPPATASQAAGVFGWLDELTAHRNASRAHTLTCETLARQLDDQVPVAELEATYFALSQMDDGVPELLEHRYQDRLQAIERGKRSKLLIRASVIVAILAALATGTVFGIGWLDELRRFDEYTTQLEDAIEGEDVPLLEELLIVGHQDYPDELTSILIKQRQQADDLIKIWTTQRKQCEEMLAAFGSMPPADITPYEMKRLDDLCKTDQEQQQYERIKKQRTNAMAKRYADARQEFEGGLEEARQRYYRIKSEGIRQPQVVMEKCRIILHSLAGARKAGNKAGLEQGLLAKSSSLQREIETHIKEMGERISNTGTSVDIIESLRQGDLPSSVLIQKLTELQQVAAVYRDNEEIDQVLRASELLAALDSWSSIRARIPEDLLELHNSPADAKELGSSTKAIISNPVISNQQLADLTQYLRSIHMIHENENKPRLVLDDFLHSTKAWARPDLQRLVTTRGNWYTEKAGTLLHYLEHKYYRLTGVISAEKTRMVIPNEDRPDGVKRSEFKLESTGLMQWIAITEADGTLTQPPADPTIWHLDLLAKLVSIKSMEPTVQLALAARLAEMHQKLAWPPMQQLEAIAAKSKSIPADGWANPNTAVDQRTEAQEMLDNYRESDIKILQEKTITAVRSLSEALPPAYMQVGVVWCDDSGRKQAYLNESQLEPRGTYEIYAIMKQGHTYVFERVAKQDAGRLSAERIDDVPLGMPLFAEDDRNSGV
jgi:hypothetical protein